MVAPIGGGSDLRIATPRWNTMTSRRFETRMITAPGALHTGRLVLAPVDPLQAADRATIVRALTEVGLAGAPIDDDAATFAAGAALGTLVAFTGCAVQFDGILSAAPVTGPWLRVPAPSPSPRLLAGRNTRPPRCPACSAPLREWRERLPCSSGIGLPGAGCDAALPLPCDACGTASRAHAWRWGRHAGVGRSFVLIEEVFPGEARPLPPLLQALAIIGVGPWDFSYVQD
jgi:hypothetical protein